jgi:hypothetical protein
MTNYFIFVKYNTKEYRYCFYLEIIIKTYMFQPLFFYMSYDFDDPFSGIWDWIMDLVGEPLRKAIPEVFEKFGTLTGYGIEKSLLDALPDFPLRDLIAKIVGFVAEVVFHALKALFGRMI